MNTQAEIRIREAFSHMELPDEPRSFGFVGKREELAAHILGTDAKQWDCVDYIIFAATDAENSWSVWRR